jgi:hypothetical protein
MEQIMRDEWKKIEEKAYFLHEDRDYSIYAFKNKYGEYVLDFFFDENYDLKFKTLEELMDNMEVYIDWIEIE